MASNSTGDGKKDADIYTHDQQIVGETSFPSSWQQAREYASAGAQTVPPKVKASEAQTEMSAMATNERCDKQVEAKSRQAIPQAAVDGMQFVYRGSHYDDEEVADFLEGLVDDMSTLLLDNNKSGAYDGYEPNWTERLDTVRQAATLTAPIALEEEYHVTGVSWSSTGGQIAVGYGRVDTVGWCKRRGFVCVWNLNRKEFNPSQPDVTLEVGAYVTAVAFHPVLPSVLAAGSYNGEVCLWNLAEQQNANSGGNSEFVNSADGPRGGSGGPSLKAYSSFSSNSSPKEPISRLQWLQNFQEQNPSKRYILCSASQDGKVLFWNPSKRLTECEAAYDVQNKKHFIVGVQGLSFAHSGGGGGSSSSSSSGGGKAANSVPSIDSVMILGAESGEVFRTRPGVTTTRTALDIDHYDAHAGPVHGIDCSPFFRNLFMSCSSDGSVRLYSALERRPLATLEPSPESKHFMYNCQFSPYRASVFAAVSRSSYLHIYDLERSKNKPALSVEAGAQGSPVLCTRFCAANPELLATGDMRGNVQIWQLSAQLYTPTELERAAVRKSEAPPAKAPAANANADESTAERAKAAEALAEDPVKTLFGFTL